MKANLTKTNANYTNSNEEMGNYYFSVEKSYLSKNYPVKEFNVLKQEKIDSIKDQKESVKNQIKACLKDWCESTTSHGN